MTVTEASDAQSTYGLKQFKDSDETNYLFTLDMSMNVPLIHERGSM